MVFHISLSDSKSPQVSFGDCTKSTITIGIIVTFTSHGFSISYLGPGTYPSFRLLSVVRWDGKVHNSASSPFFVNYY